MISLNCCQHTLDVPAHYEHIMNIITICWAGCYRCKSLHNCFAPGSDIDHGAIHEDMKRQAFRLYSPL